MKNHKAFTLVELMVIISVIGILSSFVIVQMNGAINSGKDTQRKADIGLLANALVQYSSDHYNSKVATDIDGCQIGGTTDKCSTDIENSLKSYLPTLPDDPNADASYTYQSNGSDCTISATLSDGTVYQYACDTQLATTGTPIDGECGSAAGDYDDDLVAFTTTNYCAFGDPEPITPVFPTERGTEVTWQCPGQYLGDPKACYARRGKDGACGTA